ncbi:MULTISPECIES: hypothetical protein [unclassified Streptomyces]|nr:MULTISPECIES: hypothetical protein [unclassified Streptomyces]
MESTDRMADFLDAVDALRDEEEVRSTAHTSSVSADGWVPEADQGHEA